MWLWSPDLDRPDEDDPDQRTDARRIEPIPSRVAYGDMEGFIAGVQNRRAADLLERAIGGRGAFRRFKDTLFEFPDLRQEWFEFSDRRMRRRALEFLVDEDLVDLEAAATALNPGSSTRPTRTRGGPVCRSTGGRRRPPSVVRRPCRRRRALRLYARGDNHPDSDIDLAVILDDMASPWDELRNMDGVLWRHTLESGLTVTATPINRHEWKKPTRPLVRTVKAEGRSLG